jgi:hypothetical protein
MTIMTDAQLRQFLLGKLATDETARVEEAIFLEEGFAERLREMELDLLDDYAWSRLTAADAASVERHLLGSIENRRSVQIARARHPGAASRRPAQLAWLATLLAACVIAIAVIPRWREPSPQVEPPASSPNRASVPGTGLAAASALRIVSLLADVSRGAARPSITVGVGASAVRLQAEVPEETPDSLYTLLIRDASGHTLFDQGALAVHQAGPYRFVEAVVPAAALAPGDRTVLLTKSGAAAGSGASFQWQVTGVLDPQTKK